MHSAKGDIVNAVQHYEWAVNLSNSFEGTYRLATLTRDQDCRASLSRFKSVAERGDWLTGDKMWKEASQRWEKSLEWNKETFGRHEAEAALLTWWRLAAMGYESAQNNVAFILDQDKQRVRLPGYDAPVNQTLAKISLEYWEKSAAQHVLDSNIKAADYHFKGLGTEVDHKKAAELYLSSDSSSLALWNVGWMYEYGLGLPIDLNLAKRYYDLALEVNSHASIPVLLSLFHLYIKSIWKWISGGDENNLLFNFALKDGLSSREREERIDRQDAREAVNRVDWMAYDDHTGATAGQSQSDFVDGLLERSNGAAQEDGFQSTTFVVVVFTLVAAIYLRNYVMERARQRTVDRLTEEITRRAHEQASHTASAHERAPTQEQTTTPTPTQPQEGIRHRTSTHNQNENDDT